MEHEVKIAALEEAMKKLQSEQSNESVSEETLTALQREVEMTLPLYDDFWNDQIGNNEKINITHYNVIDTNGEATVQVYLEGNYGWKQDENGTFEAGRYLAYNFINRFNPIAEMYGVEVKYEFYQNGEPVSPNAMMP